MTALPDQTEFESETFQSLDCRETTVTGTAFHGCTFTGGQFSLTRFLRCKFVDCTFRACDLSNAGVKGCTLRDVAFADSKLLGINWTEVQSVAHLSCADCVLSFSNFSGLDLRLSRFTDCVAREIELAHANLGDAVCCGTDFAGSRFLQTNLTRADFRNARNYAIRPGDNVLKKTKFSLPEATSLLYGLDIILEN